MFIRNYTDVPKAAPSTHWTDPVYRIASDYNYSVSGLFDTAARGKPITRKQVAEIIAGASGVDLSGNEAIAYLLGPNN